MKNDSSIRTPLLLIAVFVTLCTSGFAAEQTSISAIQKTHMGEFVTISGTVDRYFPSDSDKSPAAFIVKDGSGKMRVCAWPDIFHRIAGVSALSKRGTRVTLTAEIAEYNDKIELHVADYAEVHIKGATSPPEEIEQTDASTTQTTPSI
jgi:hypothetical protein